MGKGKKRKKEKKPSLLLYWERKSILRLRNVRKRTFSKDRLEFIKPPLLWCYLLANKTKWLHLNSGLPSKCDFKILISSVCARWYLICFFVFFFFLRLRPERQGQFKSKGNECLFIYFLFYLLNLLKTRSTPKSPIT